MENFIVNKLPLLLVVMLSACAGDYDVNTNLDPQNFKEYFKPSEVKLYPPSELPQEAQRIAAVSGFSCQESGNAVPASIADARTDARIKAANLGANALVVDVCETEQDTESPACVSLVSCYARAFSIPVTEQP
ncbi:hypothetical protein GCM10011369_22380 [Neiella marina]|uniref:RcsF protein n=1 Tax=Neiella marina TaxID=508461 RepID=A0A8J2XPB6_9GAMM|nr:Rcs stress response system protein RcsF [Neiella marina]GGA79917.1 hypothetical protein GCM10011369_22380 [Neiella marina]